MLSRHLQKWAFNEVLQNNSNPMVFVTGPRQVGKTFVVKHLSNVQYFNWDTTEVRKAFARDPYFFRDSHRLVIFDEIHKRRDWKKLLKGYFDSPSRDENFIVTGSGRMDLYQKGGDSLQGRYQTAHLFPLHLDELLNKKKMAPPRDFSKWEPQRSPVSRAASEGLQQLLKYSGFPEPFLKSNSRFLNRWQDEYINRLVREDVRDVSKIEKLDQLDLLARLLPERVCSPLSHLSLSGDVEVSPLVIKSWLRVFEWLYFGFNLKPFHKKIHRAVKKEPKWYFYNWSFNDNLGSRFENFIAIQLLTVCRAWRDQGYGAWELFYVRDQDQREVDFLITKNLEPVVLIEAKSGQGEWTKSLEYYTKKLKIPGFCLSETGEYRKTERGWILGAAEFIEGLLME